MLLKKVLSTYSWDIDKKLVDELNAKGKYTIHKATRDGIRVTEIENGFEAVHTEDTEKLQKISENPSQTDIDAMTGEMVDIIIAQQTKK